MKYYMNVATGSVDTKENWDYENEDGETVNAVDLGEVVEVVKEGNDWVEPEDQRFMFVSDDNSSAGISTEGTLSKIYMIQDTVEGYDVFISYFKTEEEAMDQAESDWNQLHIRDKKRHTINVCAIPLDAVNFDESDDEELILNGFELLKTISL